MTKNTDQSVRSKKEQEKNVKFLSASRRVTGEENSHQDLNEREREREKDRKRCLLSREGDVSSYLHNIQET